MKQHFFLLLQLAVVGTISDALKLTPIQPSRQKIDLFTEVQNTEVALATATSKLEHQEFPMNHMQSLLDHFEYQRLQTMIKRWLNIEEKLRITLTTESSLQQVSI
jgi:hypothetical protein